MYCIKCGKPTESGVLCAGCQQKLAEQTVCTTDNVDAEVIPAEQQVVVVEKTMRVVSEADLEENQKKACKNQLSSAIVAFIFSILAFVPIVGILCAIAATALSGAVFGLLQKSPFTAIGVAVIFVVFLFAKNKNKNTHDDDDHDIYMHDE